MTSNELRHLLNKEYETTRVWPVTYKVDYETYCNCIQAVIEQNLLLNGNDIEEVIIIIGPNKRLKFKGTELIIP